MKKYAVAVVGATGLVGRTILKALKSLAFPVKWLVRWRQRAHRETCGL